MIVQEKQSPAISTDQEFIAGAYGDFKRLMFKTAQQYVPDLTEQEDIVQNAVEKLVGRIATLRALDRPALCAYVACTVRSVAVDFLRSQKRESTNVFSIDQQEPDEWAAPGEPLDDYVASKERAQLLKKVWPDLSEENRVLLEGKYILGYSDTELSEKLDCRASSIRMKLTRARRCALELMAERKGGVVNE